jgi:ketosteroid isomerase-like protein
MILEGQDALEFIAATFDHVRFTMTITEVHPSADPDLVMVEYTSQGKYLETNRPYRNRYIALWWFRNGRVCRIREFYDPAAGILHDASVASHAQLVDEDSDRRFDLDSESRRT